MSPKLYFMHNFICSKLKAKSTGINTYTKWFDLNNKKFENGNGKNKSLFLS